MIDHFGQLRDAPPVESDAAVHQSKLNGLFDIARGYNTHVLAIHVLTAQGLRAGTIKSEHLKGGAGSSYDPDNIILLSTDEDLEFLVGDRPIAVNIVVDKCRHGFGDGYGGQYQFGKNAGYFGVDVTTSDIAQHYQERITYHEPNT